MAQNRTRPKQIIIRMTQEEYDAYQKRLQKTKLNGNSFGIKCLLNNPITVIDDIPELIRQLKGIGNNLNQLARAANSGKDVPINFDELDEGVKEIWRWLRSAKEVKV